MNALARKNNDEAARFAKLRGTPYVLWNDDELLDPGLLTRLPRFESADYTPKGWERVCVEWGHNILGLVADQVVRGHRDSETFGFAFVPSIARRGHDDALAIFRPLDGAHGGLMSPPRKTRP